MPFMSCSKPGISNLGVPKYLHTLKVQPLIELQFIKCSSFIFSC